MKFMRSSDDMNIALVGKFPSCRCGITTFTFDLAQSLGSVYGVRAALIKIGANVVHHARYVTFQLAEVVMPGEGHMGDVGLDKFRINDLHHPKNSAKHYSDSSSRRGCGWTCSRSLV